MLKLQTIRLICLLLSLQQHHTTASYAELPIVFNAPSNGFAYATPLPCDSPPPTSPHASFGGAAYAKPLVLASFPLSYAAVPQFNYAAPVAPTFVKYAPEPRVKVSAGLPVTTTYTTAVGFAAPAPVPVPLGFAAAPIPATFGAPPASYGGAGTYAAPSHFFGSAAYAPHSFLARTPLVRKFHAPSPVTGYSYAQAASNVAW